MKYDVLFMCGNRETGEDQDTRSTFRDWPKAEDTREQAGLEDMASSVSRRVRCNHENDH